MKMHFSDLFFYQNGRIEPKVPVHINGMTMMPGVISGGGVYFGGLDLNQLVNKYLEVDVQNGVHVIKGFYNS